MTSAGGSDSGIQFPSTPDGRRSTTDTARAVFDATGAGAFQFWRDGQPLTLDTAMASPLAAGFRTATPEGRDRSAPATWEVPYRGQSLSGDGLLRQLEKWERAGVMEPSHAEALRLVQRNPDWLDLSDRTMVLLGAAGASTFGVEIFEPSTTNALMAALWVHDLRNPAALSDPRATLRHPLELIMQGANHGGMWRLPYLPRSVLPLAALAGFTRRSMY